MHFVLDFVQKLTITNYPWLCVQVSHRLHLVYCVFCFPLLLFNIFLNVPQQIGHFGFQIWI